VATWRSFIAKRRPFHVCCATAISLSTALFAVKGVAHVSKLQAGYEPVNLDEMKLITPAIPTARVQ
jgi:hypothetical protein